MLVGDGWAFIHVPKCGGTAVRSVLSGTEVGKVRPMGNCWPDHSPWHRIDWIRPRGRVFCMVRRPADWIRSYWTDQSPERVGAARYLHRFWDDDLNVFVANLCAGHPGYVSALYREYTRYPNTRVFRIEDGLAGALNWATGQDYDAPRINASGTPAWLNARSRQLVEESEQCAIEKYGYGQ